MKLDLLSYLGFVGPGWNNLLANCLQELEDICNQKGYDVEIMQLKEKFGSLRIYLSSYYPELEEIIDRYSKLSETTCEQCGNPSDGVHLYKGWYRSLCGECKMKNSFMPITESLAR